MADLETTPVMDEKRGDQAGGKVHSGEPARSSAAVRPRGFFDKYKPEQGGWTRKGTFAGSALLVVWGGYFLYDHLSVLEGDEWWRLVIWFGVPLVFTVGFGVVAWWLSFSHSRAGDFMIATEGEMKKVSWSSRAEVIGSTKVVIAMVIMFAILLFGVDLLFQWLFSSIGVLKS